MGIFKKFKNVLPLMFLLPFSSFGNELNFKLQNLADSNENLYFEISATKLLILHLNTSKAIIVTKNEHKLLLDADNIEPVGVQFHEESSTVDLTTFDGITVHISLDAFSTQPGNIEK